MNDYYVNIKWLAIVIPVLGIGFYEILRHLFLENHFHSQTNSLILLFSVGLFGFLFTSWLIKSIKKIHNTLFWEQYRLKSIFEHTSDGIIVLDGQGTIVEMNPAMEKLTGWKAKDVVGKFTCDELTRCSDSKEACWNTMDSESCMGVDCGHRECWGKACLQKKISIPYVEMCTINKFGKKIRVAASYSYIPGFGELEPQVKMVLRDVSERKEFERAIENYATLEERYRLAREIHDGLAQTLIYLNLKCYSLEKKVLNLDYDLALEEIQDLRQTTKEAVNDVRQNIYDLKAPIHEDNSCFKKWLGNFLDQYCQINGLNYQLNPINIQELQIPADIKVQLIRVIQEALTNVRKHAQAKNLLLSLEKDNQVLKIQIIDDGIGMDMDEYKLKKDRHFGITIMKERRRSIGGNLEINSLIEQGTTITIALPLACLKRIKDKLA